MTLTLHHLEASRSMRILWLLEYLQVPYKLNTFPRDQTSKLAECEPFSGKGLAAIHPIGRSPLLEDDDLQLAESGTIIRYLLEYYNEKKKSPKPSERTQKALDMNFWIDFSEASIMLHLIPLNYLLKGKAQTKDGSSAQEKAIARGIRNDMTFVETSLEKNGGTLAGGSELGPADFANLFGIEFFTILVSAQPAEWRENLNLHVGTETDKWIKRCHRDSFYKKACSLERGGKVPPEKYLDFLVGKQ